jgi:hypothetical protein
MYNGTRRSCLMKKDQSKKSRATVPLNAVYRTAGHKNEFSRYPSPFPFVDIRYIKKEQL